MKKGLLFEAVAVLLLTFLVFLLYVMVAGGASSSGQWALSGFGISNSESGSMFIGPGNVLYVVSGDRVNAISPDGRIRWAVSLNESTRKYNATCVGQQAAFDNDTVYLLLRYGNQFVPVGRELIAISDNGKPSWNRRPEHLDNATVIPKDTSILAGGNQVYLHTGEKEMVYSRDGRLLWNISNINAGRSVDPKGNLYVMPGSYGFSVIDAYLPDGRLKWEYRLGNDTFSQFGGSAGVTYYDHTVYAALNKSLMALDENAGLVWKRPFDGDDVNIYRIEGGWYVQHVFRNGTGNYDSIIDPDGDEKTLSEPYAPGSFAAIANHLLITGSRLANPGNPGLNDLDAYRIEAYDIKSGNEAWNYTISPGSIDTTLNESNVNDVMYGDGGIGPGGYGDSWDAMRTNMLTPEAWYKEHSLPYGYEEVKNYSTVTETVWDGGIYVSYWAYNYEYPFFFDRSRCVYAGGLYALDNNGTLLWVKSTNSQVTTVVANNSTVYYNTKSGRLSADNAGVAAGLALTAAFYLFIRFVLAGAVTRARGIVDKNEKRNQVLKYIGDNPGSSLHEISRSLKISLGTARYHLLILGLNHRIVSCRADNKYVRYFTNAGSYSRERQIAVSLMRREGIKKVLCLLLENPGMSNVELSKVLGAQESATSRYMIELLRRNIVTREPVVDGTLSYYIRSEFKEPVAFAAERLGCRAPDGLNGP